MTAAIEVFDSVPVGVPVRTRKPPRRARVAVDPSHFAPDVADAMKAFANDVSYAVQMARAAVAIGHKRQAWQARRAEKNAD